MKVLLTGATGFIGKKLCQSLLASGHQLHILTRDAKKAEQSILNQAGIRFFSWNYKTEMLPVDCLSGVDAVINLMGESVASGRWTEQRKQEILSSRILSTEKLVAALQDSATYQHQVKTFISTSAIGIYGAQQDNIIDESYLPVQLPSDFLATVCRQWEAALQPLNKKIRTCIVRVGIVLGKESGALKQMLLPFQLNLGGPIGDGKQYMSWIHIDDIVAVYQYLLEHDHCVGVYNGTAPQPVTNSIFSQHLAKVLHRLAIFPVPRFMLKLIFAEMSDVILTGQRVLPNKILQEGYTFKYSNLDGALKQILKVSEK